MAGSWSQREVSIAVNAYFDMLEAELTGVSYNKAEIRRMVLPQLNGRSEGSLEFKNCNISAALISLGLPPIDGYKPRWNYQRDMLHAVIGEVLGSRQVLFDAVEHAVEEPAESSGISNILSIYDSEPPARAPLYQKVAEAEPKVPSPIKRNYLELETRNRSVGLGGEELVLQYERARLIAINREKLADRVEHTSIKQGDGTGFDIRSFDEHGNDLFIEVKTTRFRKEAPFFISANEVEFSASNADRYSLYRVYGFTKDPKLFILSGNISQHCQLTATNFRGSF